MPENSKLSQIEKRSWKDEISGAFYDLLHFLGSYVGIYIFGAIFLAFGLALPLELGIQIGFRVIAAALFFSLGVCHAGIGIFNKMVLGRPKIAIMFGVMEFIISLILIGGSLPRLLSLSAQ